jgi:DNA (cytosine-5)-methyltransferase 1
MRHANLIPEFERVVDEARPDWFLMENVPPAPLPSVPGYQIDSMILNNRWVGGEQMRERRLSFGTLDGRRLDVSPDLCLFEAPVVEYAVTSSGGGIAGLKFDRGGTTRPTATVEKALAAAHRPVSRLLELQGLPPDLLDEAPFTDGGKREVIANGVPLFLGRALARAIKRAMEVLP